MGHGVAEKVLIFTKLVLIIILVESFSGPLTAAAQGSGNIKSYQGFSGLIMLLIVPISYVLLELKFSPDSVFWVGVFVSIICLFVRIIILKQLMKFRVIAFIKEVLFIGSLSILSASLLPLIIKTATQQSFSNSFLIVTLTFISSLVSTFLVGLNKIEKIYFRNIIQNKIIIFK